MQSSAQASAMPPADEASKSTGQLPDLPTHGLRTVLSLLLFVHLFALGVAVLGNFGTRSGLRRQLHRAPGIQPYLQILAMDTAYNYHLIFGTSEDWDHSCQIVLNPPKSYEGRPDEVAELETIDLMPADAWPGMRRRRYLSLALNLALNENDDKTEAEFVEALARGMLNKHGGEADTAGIHRFRCQTQEPQGMLNFEQLEPELRDPNNPRWFSTIYEANLVRDTQSWELMKLPGRGERTQSRSGR